MADPCVIWRVTDGKRGHERQTEGLVRALAAMMPVTVQDIPRLPMLRALANWGLARFPFRHGDARPDLILGAGHGTHLTVLAARRACGGRAVVLMKPTLPVRCFDLCIVPMHDGVVASDRVLVTRGALNAVQPGKKREDVGLMLVGGPSPHYDWDPERVMCQIREVVERSPQVRWRLTTSPRTPSSMLANLQKIAHGTLDIVPFDRVDAAWLPDSLAQAATVWVTPDSVSMMYEALTSGAAVGLFDLEAKPSSRVARGARQLQEEGLVMGYGEWQAGRGLMPPQTTFNEAARCARWIKDTWFPDR